MKARPPARFMTQARQHWRGLPPRQRTVLAAGAAVLAAALVWWVALEPALSTLSSAAARHQTLDAQLQHMRALQAQAQTLKSQPRQNHEDAVRALEAATRERLGQNARLVIANERATATLTGVPGQALAQWLAQARINARALPAEARLNRNATGLWEGTVVLTLPAR